MPNTDRESGLVLRGREIAGWIKSEPLVREAYCDFWMVQRYRLVAMEWSIDYEEAVTVLRLHGDISDESWRTDWSILNQKKRNRIEKIIKGKREQASEYDKAYKYLEGGYNDALWGYLRTLGQITPIETLEAEKELMKVIEQNVNSW